MCHWSLNGLTTNNYIKLNLLEDFNIVHDFDIICLGETFLNSEYLIVDPGLELKGYALVRSDHPQNLKRGGVCMLYKEHFSFILRTDITFLKECIVGEIKVKNSKCFITCVYRSPNQYADEMKDFLSGLEQTCTSIALESPLCSCIVGDFNAKTTNWWPRGTNNL